MDGGATDTDGGGTDSGTTASPGPCCGTSTVPGCVDKTIEACVCAQDPRCCNQKWDAVCAALVVGAGCGTCPNDCCTPSSTPGCGNAAIQKCTCDKDPENKCCTVAWDDFCISLMTTKVLGATCGTCN